MTLYLHNIAAPSLWSCQISISSFMSQVCVNNQVIVLILCTFMMLFLDYIATCSLCVSLSRTEKSILYILAKLMNIKVTFANGDLVVQVI